MPVYLATAVGVSSANHAGLDLLGVASREELKELGVKEIVDRMKLRDPQLMRMLDGPHDGTHLLRDSPSRAAWTW